MNVHVGCRNVRGRERQRKGKKITSHERRCFYSRMIGFLLCVVVTSTRTSQHLDWITVPERDEHTRPPEESEQIFCIQKHKVPVSILSTYQYLDNLKGLILYYLTR